MQGGVAAEGFEWSRLLNSEEPPVQEHVINHEDPWVQAPGTSGMESLDYEVVENLAYREDQAQRGIWHQGSYAAMKWLFALLIGIGTGLSAFVINVAVENFSGWKFIATFAIMRHSYMAGFLVYTLFNVALVFSSVLIVTHFAPAAAGSGIPELKGCLNGIDNPGILLFRTLIGKILGSIGSVGGGLALGKEGPLVHTGACITRYALLGAASFLGGSMRMTVSICVIMVEITNNLKLLPLIMLVLLISKAVGDIFNTGFYEQQAQLRGIPVLESTPKRFMRKLTARDAIRMSKVVHFSRVSQVVILLQCSAATITMASRLLMNCRVGDCGHWSHLTQLLAGPSAIKGRFLARSNSWRQSWAYNHKVQCNRFCKTSIKQRAFHR